LKAMVLQAVALHALGVKDEAVRVLFDALALAEPGGFIRIFIDEGLPMEQLLAAAASCRPRSDYVDKLLAVLEVAKQRSEDKSLAPPSQPLVEPLGRRELDVLRLIAQGFSNHEISERLCLALDTVKGHNRKSFG